MGRKPIKKDVLKVPNIDFFKPRGIPLMHLKVNVLKIEEWDAVRLRDLEGLELEDAAKKMGISRRTFSRILKSAHEKIADALFHGKAIEIKGGNYTIGKRKFRCYKCNHVWEELYGTGRPKKCPKCGSTNIYRHEADRGPQFRGKGRGRGGKKGVSGRGKRWK